MWLDMTGIDADHMHEVLPQVVETIEKYADLDPTHDFVPVKPTAHYPMGGIPITTDGEVYRWQNDERNVVEGLFAAGECACCPCTAQTVSAAIPCWMHACSAPAPARRWRNAFPALQ